jgi:preprotein translocase subunit SecA
MYEEMLGSIGEDVIKLIFNVRVETNLEPQQEKPAEIVVNRGESASNDTTVRKGEKVGRNDPCPCGSGLKYKKCCGK